MSKMDARDEKVLEALRAADFLKLTEIQEMFGVSQSTARRLCMTLEERGHALRGIGGVQYLPGAPKGGVSPDTLYRRFSSSNMDEKDAVARYACTLVKSGDIIFISGGTTTGLFAKRLAAHLRVTGIQNVVVETNSLDCAETLGDAAAVVVTGGSYRAARRDMVGLICEKTLQKSRFNKTFLGVDGIDVEGGLMTFDIDTARVDHIALDNSARVYILADHTKFERHSFISYAHINERCEVLTDSGLPADLAERAKNSGVKLTTV